MLTRSESVRDFEPVFHTNLDSLIELPAVMLMHTCIDMQPPIPERGLWKSTSKSAARYYFLKPAKSK